MSSSEVVIVGAGPYGLSLAAHLAKSGVSFRIFGHPMHGWRTQMPRGMMLKSEGFASSLHAPRGAYPLRAFCAERSLPYQDIGLPVPVETFWSYGLEFQRRFVPMLEEREVESLEPRDGGFAIGLDNGETVLARRVVVGVGVKPFAHMPAEFAGLPDALVSHSSDHAALEAFEGREVVVVGAGASAVDLAALLHQAGARVELICRRAAIDFHAPPRRRSLRERLRAPRSGLGIGWGSKLCTDLPLVFHAMPEEFRLRVTRTHLGAAPGWFVRDQVVGKVAMTLGATIRGARAERGRVVLDLATAEGERRMEADHVIAATGYHVDLRRVPFLAPVLLERVRMVQHSPVLSSRFETSLPGLFVIGPAAANSFGPLMRFGCGCAFAALRLAPYLVRQAAGERRRIAAVGAAAPTAERGNAFS